MDMRLIRNMKKEEIIGALRGFLASFSSLEIEAFKDNDAVIEGFIAEWDNLVECGANARLIATAPELLDMLILVLPMAKGYAASHPVGDNQGKIASAQAAIAKAKGDNDFYAIMECEHCGHTQENKTGYDDDYYHNSVIPAMKCKACGNDSKEYPQGCSSGAQLKR